MRCTDNVLPIAEYFCFVPAVGRPLIYYQVYFPSSVNHFPPHLIPSSVIPFTFLYYAFPIFNEFTIATLYEIRHCYLLHFSLDLPQLSSIVYITKMLFWWLSCYVFPLLFQLCRLWESLFFWLRSIFFKAYGLLWNSFLSCCLVFGGPSTYFLDSFSYLSQLSHSITNFLYLHLNCCLIFQAPSFGYYLTSNHCFECYN